MADISVNKYVSCIRKGVKHYAYEVHCYGVGIDSIKAKDEAEAKEKFLQILRSILRENDND